MVEEFLDGEEASFFALVVGSTCIPLGSAQVPSKLLWACRPAPWLRARLCVCWSLAMQPQPLLALWRLPCSLRSQCRSWPERSAVAVTAPQPRALLRSQNGTRSGAAVRDLADHTCWQPTWPFTHCWWGQDHKAVGEGDKGPNTGGMGAYSPAPCLTPAVEAQVMREIVQRTADAMMAEGAPFTGILFAGLMIKGGQASVPAPACTQPQPSLSGCPAALAEAHGTCLPNIICRDEVASLACTPSHPPELAHQALLHRSPRLGVMQQPAASGPGVCGRDRPPSCVAALPCPPAGLPFSWTSEHAHMLARNQQMPSDLCWHPASLLSCRCQHQAQLQPAPALLLSRSQEQVAPSEPPLHACTH